VDDILVEVTKVQEDIRAARHLIDEELFQPSGHELKEENDIEEDVVYVVAKDKDKIIGAGRLAFATKINWSGSFGIALENSLFSNGYNLEKYKDKIAVMYGVVLKSDYRGQGIGSRLYDLRETIIYKHSKSLIVSRIRLDSWKIYENRSYTEFGSENLMLLNGETVTRKWVYKLNHEY